MADALKPCVAITRSDNTISGQWRIAGTRVATSIVAHAANDEGVERACHEWGLSIEQVRLAVEFEGLRRAPLPSVEQSAREFVQFVIDNAGRADHAGLLFRHLEWDQLRAEFPEIKGDVVFTAPPLPSVSVTREQLFRAMCCGAQDCTGRPECRVDEDALAAVLALFETTTQTTNQKET